MVRTVVDSGRSRSAVQPPADHAMAASTNATEAGRTPAIGRSRGTRCLRPGLRDTAGDQGKGAHTTACRSYDTRGNLRVAAHGSRPDAVLARWQTRRDVELSVVVDDSRLPITLTPGILHFDADRLHATVSVSLENVTRRRRP
jgi:hypothetical protein